MVERLTDARKTFADADATGRIWLKWAGDCEQPFRPRSDDGGNIFVGYEVRCFKCGPCLKARQRYWVAAAVQQIRECEDAGRRTWFGTLTLNPASQRELEERARFASSDPNADWWSHTERRSYYCRKRKRQVEIDAYICNERFRRLRDEALSDVQRYWKRLRKAGHEFKYLLVFEQHVSGQVHMHWLLHEAGSPILKRHLAEEWPFGFTKVKLVGGSGKRRIPINKAAYYVAKYLSKSSQCRQVASRGYRPAKRTERPAKSASPSAMPPTG